MRSRNTRTRYSLCMLRLGLGQCNRSLGRNDAHDHRLHHHSLSISFPATTVAVTHVCIYRQLMSSGPRPLRCALVGLLHLARRGSSALLDTACICLRQRPRIIQLMLANFSHAAHILSWQLQPVVTVNETTNNTPLQRIIAINSSVGE